MKFSRKVLLCVVPCFFAVSAFADAIPSRETPKITGITLESTIPGIVNGSVGYSARLLTQTGANRCLASQKSWIAVSETDEKSQHTRLFVQPEVTRTEACQEIYAPVQQDVLGYVATFPENTLTVDTGTELGVLELFTKDSSKRGLFLDAKPFRARTFAGGEWVAMEFSAKVLKGSNPCFAANTKIMGFGYALDSQLRVALKTETVEPDRYCTMEYAPVSEPLSFEVLYRPGTVKEIVFENKGEMGLDEVTPLPSWAP
jgi:hypothetical protein